MKRRAILGGSGAVLAATLSGCVGELFRSDTTALPETDVFANDYYEGRELVVEFQEGIDVERAVLLDSASGVELVARERPFGVVRFPVVFPDRMETHLSTGLNLDVRVETEKGSAQRSVWEPSHGVARNVEPARDGRARFEIENQGPAPLLVRFVGLYDGVPNPTGDLGSESFDRSPLEFGPGVVGRGRNRPLTPSRTDLVVPPGETEPFVTTYAPFAFLNGATSEDCNGRERTAMVGILQGNATVTSYTFTYRLTGDPVTIDGRDAERCGRVDERATPD